MTIEHANRVLHITNNWKEIPRDMPLGKLGFMEAYAVSELVKRHRKMPLSAVYRGWAEYNGGHTMRAFRLNMSDGSWAIYVDFGDSLQLVARA